MEGSLGVDLVCWDFKFYQLPEKAQDVNEEMVWASFLQLREDMVETEAQILYQVQVYFLSVMPFVHQVVNAESEQILRNLTLL